MAFFAKHKSDNTVKYPGTRQLMSGYRAVIICEKELSDAAVSHLASTASPMEVLWNQEKNQGHLNISGRPLIFVNLEDNSSATAATVGLSLAGLRASHFSGASQNICAMQESLYAAVGKRLPYLLHISCQSITKATANIYCSHDDYHSLNNTGFVQLFARNHQNVADLTIIGRKIAELSLNPVALAQDGFLSSQLLETLNVPSRELIQEYLGLADDIITTPTPSQTILFGKTRRRIPITWTVDQPTQSGGTQATDSYMQTVAGQYPFFFQHIAAITDQCMDEWFKLTGRRYHRINQYLCKDASYLIFAQGSVLSLAEATADYLRDNQQLKVGVVNMTVFRPFPGDLISHLCKNRKGVLVLERSDQPLSEDLPIIAEIRGCLSKAIENGKTQHNKTPFDGYASYHKTTQIPSLYSGCFGLGGHVITSQDIVAAVVNMLPKSQGQSTFYLGIDFVAKTPLSPQQEIQQQAVLKAYPQINQLTLASTAINHNHLNINDTDLIPTPLLAIRIHSLAGWKDADMGEKLAQTLVYHFNFDIKASPEQATEKQGHPTTFYMMADTKSVIFDHSHPPCNTVIATDPHIFSYRNPLANLRKNGVFIIQSALTDADKVWQQFPLHAQQTIINEHINVFFIDALAIATEALKKQADNNLSSLLDLQHVVFQSAFFKAVNFATTVHKTTKEVQSVIHNNQPLVQHSFNALIAIKPAQMMQNSSVTQPTTDTPLLLQQKPANDNAIADIHRFWNQTGSLYALNHQPDILADPFLATAITPASTAIFADMTANRTQHPQWLPENCTACGDCYSVCPENAIAGLINTVSEVFTTNIKRIEKSGRVVKHLYRAIRTAEKKYHNLTANHSLGTTLEPIFAKAIGDTIKEYAEPERQKVAEEFEWFKEVSEPFKFALTKPYHDDMNNRMPSNGGLFSITINPNSCTGCMECVTVCETDALPVITQTPQSINTLRACWHYWLDLPTSNKKYSLINNLQEKKGILNTLLLDKQNHNALFSSANTRSGSGEKTAIHLFTSTVSALMQPRVTRHIKHINQLIDEMETHIRLRLMESLDIGDIDALETAMSDNQNVDLTLSRLSGYLDKDKATQPIDRHWLKWVLKIVADLKHLKWRYIEGPSREGRANLGIAQGNGDATPWAETFPFNPYPFPWASHLSQDAPALALGLFEGHMVNMAKGFKAIRIAELIIKGKYDKTTHDTFFSFFGWQQFTEDEYLLCPPIVTINAENGGFESDLHGLSAHLLSNIPLKILVLDNQHARLFSGLLKNDPLKNNASQNNKPKELGLIAMAHQNAYVHQGGIAHTAHLLGAYIDGLNYRGPALWNVYACLQPEKNQLENNIANHSFTLQSRLAVESRTHPLITFDPRLGKTWEACIDLTANPQLDQNWITYSLEYTDEYGNKFAIDTPLTFADWALTEPIFNPHFQSLAADTETDDMVLLTDYIAMSTHEREHKTPFIWAVQPQTNHLLRVQVSLAMVHATQQRNIFWRILKDLGGHNKVEVDIQAIIGQAKAEMAQTITEGLISMIDGDSSVLKHILDTSNTASPSPSSASLTATKKLTSAKVETQQTTTIKQETIAKKSDVKGKQDYEAVWIETPDCTTCDECVDIAPDIFQYNADKKAIVIDPTKGTFEDIVRSAEKCTAVIIHPGTPWNPDEPNLDKLIKRAEKFQ